MKNIIIFFLIFVSLASLSVLRAQENKMGQISGNFQTDSQLYFEDLKIGADKPNENILSNTWANFTYTLGNFSAGIRFESYLNTLKGFPNSGGVNDGFGIPYRWAMFSNDDFEITIGNFYEQFGNGLILRSYEEKTIGIDNALEGFRVKYNPMPGVYLKGIMGRQRSYWKTGPGIVRGFDGELMLNDLISGFADKDLRLNIGASFVSKYQKSEDPIFNLPSNIGSGAARINVQYKKFALNSEYAYKINDPSYENDYIYKDGQTFLLNATYSTRGLGIVLGTKWVDNMSSRSDRNATLTDLNINQLPEITRNHVYTLPAFYPYATQPNGEWGSKAEVTYKIKKGSLLGGKYGTTLSLNYSRVHSIDKQQINDSTPIGQKGTLGYKTKFFSIGKELYFQDFNIEISKKWNKNLYSNLSYVNLTYNYDLLRGKIGYDNVLAHIGIADITYKFSGGMALKTEVQGMFTKQDEGNWASCLFEFTIPNWFFTALNNWNYGNPDSKMRIHYPSVGFGYIKGASRIQLTYGKTRSGVMCVGGVCRTVPSSNGFTISISSTF